MTLRLYRVIRTENTRLDVDGETLGWGIEFPSGLCVTDWNRSIFPPEDRLDHPHLSQYGSLDDVEQGSGGEVVIEEELDWGA